MDKKIGLFTVTQYPGKSQQPIIFFGAGKIGHALIAEYELQYMEYNVVYFVDNDIEKHNKVIKPLVAVNIPKKNVYYNKEIPIISTDEMIDYCTIHPECIIVLAVDECIRPEIEQQIAGIENPVVNPSIFKALCLREYVELHIKKYNIELAFQYYQQYYNFVNKNVVKEIRPLVSYLDKGECFISVVSPPKTGNNTIIRLLNNNCIMATDFHNGYTFQENSDDSYWMKLVKEGCNKFIIGVRDPISQNVSLMYNEIINMYMLDNSAEMDNLDAQQLFNHIIVESVMGRKIRTNMFDRHYEIENKSEAREYLIQNFFDGSIKRVLDIDVYNIGFNKEKGYGIGEQKGKKIFVYQLEKLQNLERELASFLQVNNIAIDKVNDGAQKYYAKQYHNFLNNFSISREYFECCYNNKYIKKFYSEEDIEKFKKKWNNHIN